MKREAWASLTTAILSFVCRPYTMPVSRHSCEEPYVYRMWGGTVSLDGIEAGLKEIRNGRR